MNDDYTIYGFTYRDCNGKISKHEVTVDDITWPEVLDDFVNFLQNVYGYDIKSSIRVREPEYTFQPAAWNGDYFSEKD